MCISSRWKNNNKTHDSESESVRTRDQVAVVLGEARGLMRLLMRHAGKSLGEDGDDPCVCVIGLVAGVMHSGVVYVHLLSHELPSLAPSSAHRRAAQLASGPSAANTPCPPCCPLPSPCFMYVCG